LLVSSPNVTVLNSGLKHVFSQIKPVWVAFTESIKSRPLQLDFVADVPALGLATYMVSDIG